MTANNASKSSNNLPYWVLGIIVFFICYNGTRAFNSKQKPDYVPIKPAEHTAAELEFKPLPPSMCWARVKGKPSVWFYGVQRKDGTWLLLPSQFQPSYEEYQALDY